jgi:nucleoside 2-deoxyribosyltransferase
MNIYFACSITGGREFESTYQEIVAELLRDGHEIPTSHLAQTEIMENERVLAPCDVYERDVNWIKSCDVLIAEVSVPSHGVGYEIAFALGIGKHVLCLHQKDKQVSKMITGNLDPALKVIAYSNSVDAVLEARVFLRKL